MASFNVIDPLAQKILTATNAWSGIAGQLAGLVMAPILVGVTILVMWHGFNILRGAGGQHHLLDVFAKCLRAFFVVVLALSAGAYASNVQGFFQDLRTGLTGMFVSGSTTSYTALDTAIGQALSSWDPTWDWASIHIKLLSVKPDVSGVVGIICWFFMVAALTIFAAICAINLLLIDFSLALLFALGPMFVACFAFQSTARFFDAWLGGVLKYTFTAVVISAMVGLGIGILQTYTSALASTAGALDFVTAAFSAIGASLVLCVLANRIPSIAGDIVGGIGIAAFGPAMAMRPLQAAASLAGSVAGGAANAGTYVAGRTLGQSAASSSIGQRAVAAYESLSQSAGSARSVLSGSVANAFDAGRGFPSGTGVVTGAGRPVGTMHTPGNS